MDINKVHYTPKGKIEGFVAIEAPSQKFNNYSLSVVFEHDAAKEMRKSLVDVVEYAKKNIKGFDNGNIRSALSSNPYGEDKLLVKFNSKAFYITKDQRRIDNKVEIYDIDNKPVYTELKIGEGTICSVGYKLIPWSNKFGNGIKTTIEKVKIYELVTYGSDKLPAITDDEHDDWRAHNEKQETGFGDF